ncbi:VanZ family protein [Jidongwangia harbinensis]|uniref:VanZ family protein n=1 Tax=Jidongwangia harbinensis TaxID=2878561 RepID=UPI001CD9D1A9|nr:VanZ family protein [Jidongwangia harbinensis]MCA2213298.1 VanZ family protein [Jidongwangia harbinensis]
MLTTEDLWGFVTGPAPLTVLAITLVVAWPAARWIAGRTGSRPLVAALFLLWVGIVVALTLTPSDPVPVPPHYLEQIGHPRLVLSLLTAAPSDAEQVANILLYVPVGFLARLVWRRTVPAALIGLVLTVAIETCQYSIIGRAGSITDIRNNTAGAVIGALLGATVHGGAQWWRSRPR